VASRTTIGAGVVPNNDCLRAAWILNPQTIKPGVNMPSQAFSLRDLNAINVYLGTLQ
jgi:cytochrome c oxidase subunit II